MEGGRAEKASREDVMGRLGNEFAGYPMDTETRLSLLRGRNARRNRSCTVSGWEGLLYILWLYRSGDVSRHRVAE